MLQFNNNHIFTGYLKQFLSSFNLPTCRIYTSEFEKFFSEHGFEDPRVLESSLPVEISSKFSAIRPGVSITYLKNGYTQQYFWETANNSNKKYWKSNKAIQYNGNKVLGLTTTLKNPTTLYNSETHEYLGEYLRFIRDYEGINLMSMYNCFSNRLCNNIKFKFDWSVDFTEYDDTGEKQTKTKTVEINANTYNTNYKIYMLPVKLFENYTIAIDCYQGVELFCGFYNQKFDTSDKNKAVNLLKKTYVKIPKAQFNQPFLYDKLNVKYWSWEAENDKNNRSTAGVSEFLRSEIAMRESDFKLFIKIPANNTSSITVLEGDYRNFNDALYTVDSKCGWQYFNNSTALNFETKKTYAKSTLPELNSREFKPISKLQLLALNTGISYPFADRLIEYLIANVILPNDATPDNIKRLQKVMEDCGYSFQIDGVWEPKMQMILYDYLMNSGKFVTKETTDKFGQVVHKVKNERVTRPDLAGNLRQRGQSFKSDFYDVLGYGDKDAEKLYASWKIETLEKNGKLKHQVIAKTTLENVDIYSNLYNN